MNFDNVLVPIDGSYLSEIATHLAVDVAAIANTHLTFVYVMDTSQINSFGTVDHQRERLMLEQEGKLALDHAISAATMSNVPHRAIIIEGVPDLIISELSRDQNVLVMGITGKSGFRRGVIGGTAEKVIEDCHCPIMTLKSGSHEMHNIMLPVAFANDNAIDFAIESTKFPDCKLSMFVINGDSESAAKAEIILKKCELSGIKADIMTGKMDLTEAVIAHSGMFELIVLGHDTKYNHGKLGKTPQSEIIKHASCPVTLVKNIY